MTFCIYEAKSVRDAIRENTNTTCFNMSLSVQVRMSRQKVEKKIDDATTMTSMVDLMDVYWTPSPKNKKYTFFSGTHNMLTKIDSILNCKENIGNFMSKNMIYNTSLYKAKK